MTVLIDIIECYLPEFCRRDRISPQCIEAMECCPKIVFPFFTLKKY